jgi:DNA (cytosine-5)-methyltransferase 1
LEGIWSQRLAVFTGRRVGARHRQPSAVAFSQVTDESGCSRMESPNFRVAALFAGIGGIELGFHRALGDQVHTELFCEVWEPAKAVLAERFAGVEVHPDVRELKSLPSAVNLITAGFPCTDLSQAGLTNGIRGQHSGLVGHVFGIIEKSSTSKSRPTVVIENVSNMLALDRGEAMRFLVAEFEALGYRWAYRVVDSRFTGVPQRRRRVIFVASTELEPADVLFADDAGPIARDTLADDAFGFYWTEGRRGLGWAQDAVPTLKGGSTIGIPSPPAIWVPKAVPGHKFVKPSIEDAEAMQGFDRGWTAVGEFGARSLGTRWKLVGNAVTVGVARWLGERLAEPGERLVTGVPWTGSAAWPTAAWGHDGMVFDASRLSEFPLHVPYRHLSDLVPVAHADVLSPRGAEGFWKRLRAGNLGQHPGFRTDIAEHIEVLETIAA